MTEYNDAMIPSTKFREDDNNCYYTVRTAMVSYVLSGVLIQTLFLDSSEEFAVHGRLLERCCSAEEYAAS